jgi:hypothetical protein
MVAASAALKATFFRKEKAGDRYFIYSAVIKSRPIISTQSRSPKKNNLRHPSAFLRNNPPTDGGGLTISGNLKSFEGPVLKCRGSRERRALYLNELVIHEIRNNASTIVQKFLFQLL